MSERSHQRHSYTKSRILRDSPLSHLGSLSTIIGLSLNIWAQHRSTYFLTVSLPTTAHGITFFQQTQNNPRRSYLAGFRRNKKQQQNLGYTFPKASYWHNFCQLVYKGTTVISAPERSGKPNTEHKLCLLCQHYSQCNLLQQFPVSHTHTLVK